MARAKAKTQDVRFRRSLMVFASALVSVIVLALVGQLAMNRLAVQEQVTDLLSDVKHYQVDVPVARVQLADGWWPVVGLFFPRIEVRDSRCINRKLILHNTLVRLAWGGLLSGEIRPSRVHAEFGDIEHSENCMSSSSNDSRLSEHQQVASSPKKQLLKLVKTSDVESIFKLFKDQVDKEYFNHLVIDQMRWVFRQSSSKTIMAQGSLNFEWNDFWQLHFYLDTLQFVGRKLDLLNSHLLARLDDQQLVFDWSSKVREGVMKFKVNLQNQKDFPTAFVWSLKKVPVSALTSLFDSPTEFRYLWVNCGGQFQDNFQSFMSSAMVLDPCKIDGPYGEIRVDEVQASLSKIKNFKLRLLNLNIDKLIEKKRNILMSGVLSSYGFLSAQLEFKHPRWHFLGQFTDMAFLFSNDNLSDVQKVKAMPIEIKGDLKRWQLKVSDVELEKGEWVGDILLQSKKPGHARGRVAIHKVLLEPKIYQLMISSEASPFTVYGQFEHDKQEINNWSAVLAAKALKSQYYSLKNLKIKAEGRGNDQVRAHVLAGRGEMQKQSPVVDWVMPTLLDQPLEGRIPFREMSFHLNVFKDRSVTWKRGYLRLANGWQMSTEGQRSGVKQWSGWLQWDAPKRQPLRWSYKGPLGQSRWIPESKSVMEWLKAHPEFVKSQKAVGFNVESDTSITEKINDVGQKAIKKAKDLLKKDSKDEGS